MINKYKFKGKEANLKEISRYYWEKGIDLKYGVFFNIVKGKVEELGRDNITEEIIIDCVKETIKKRTLSAVDSGFKTNCIREFGEDFWNELLAYKEESRRKSDKNKYPFHNGEHSIGEIILYYKKNGIFINREWLYSAIKRKKREVGREELTQEEIMSILEEKIKKDKWETLKPEEKKFCLEEFGIKNKNKNFRQSMQQSGKFANKSVSERQSVKIIEKGKVNGEDR